MNEEIIPCPFCGNEMDKSVPIKGKGDFYSVTHKNAMDSKCFLRYKLFGLTEWNRRLQINESPNSGAAPTDNKPLCTSGDAKLPSFNVVFCDFCKAYAGDSPLFLRHGFELFYNFIIHKLGNFTKR